MNYFNEKKAAQAAAYLLKLNGGKMNYMKLIKLLYLADRNTLAHHGYTITSDNYVSMNQGMVLSNVLDLINNEVDEKESKLWAKYISVPSDYNVSLSSPDTDMLALSEVEIEILRDVFSKYGKLGVWEIVDKIHHNLKEWKNPHGSMIPVSLKEILDAVSENKEENAKIAEDIEAADEIRKFMEE